MKQHPLVAISTMIFLERKGKIFKSNHTFDENPQEKEESQKREPLRKLDQLKLRA